MCARLFFSSRLRRQGDVGYDTDRLGRPNGQMWIGPLVAFRRPPAAKESRERVSTFVTRLNITGASPEALKFVLNAPLQRVVWRVVIETEKPADPDVQSRGFVERRACTIVVVFFCDRWQT